MTTMITGAGLVGSQIARILVQQGEKPVLFDIAPNLNALADAIRTTASHAAGEIHALSAEAPGR